MSKGKKARTCRLCVWSDGRMRVGCQIYGETRNCMRCRNYSEWPDGWMAGDDACVRERLRLIAMRWLRRVGKGDARVPHAASMYVAVLVDMLGVGLRRRKVASAADAHCNDGGYVVCDDCGADEGAPLRCGVEASDVCADMDGAVADDGRCAGAESCGTV